MIARVRCFAFLGSLVFAGCGVDVRGRSDGGAPFDPSLSDLSLSEPFLGSIYANTRDFLYKIDPDHYTATLIGQFTMAGVPLNTFDLHAGPYGDPSPEGIANIALDKDGSMMGVSGYGVYSIDKETAACKRLSILQFPDPPNNGHADFRAMEQLGFVPAGAANSVEGHGEMLLAVTRANEIYRIDPATGAATHVGKYTDDGHSSANGDIVYVPGIGVVATIGTTSACKPVVGCIFGYDYLASIDLGKGGAQSLIGPTPIRGGEVTGLATWRGKLFGFTTLGDILLIDPRTGAVRTVATGGPAWYGAGVTTSAPSIPIQ